MFKRMMAWLMLLCLLATGAATADEIPVGERIIVDEDGYTHVGNQELVGGYDDLELPVPVGPVFPDKTLKDFNKNSPALYTCKILEDSNGYAERDLSSKRLVAIGANGAKAEILHVDPLWVIARCKGQISYVRRRRIVNVEPVDPTTTPPYGTQKHQYVAKTADYAEVRVSMDRSDKSWVILNPGTTLTIYCIVDGWAVVNYWRSYAYIEISDLTDLVMISPTDNPLNNDTPIAAYTSYYKLEDSDKNRNRNLNIDIGIRRMSVTLQPGESFDCNKQMGPYSKANGYVKAGTLNDGASSEGYGGGTCQVSSTIYNALLQLPGVTITKRRPHGENAAPYLPHGVDAAVGNDKLNLIFRNDYDFPIRLEGHTSYDGALCWLIYRADTEEASATASK